MVNFNNQLRKGGDLFKQLEGSPKAVASQIEKLSADYIRLVTSQQRATKTGNWRQTEAEIKRVQGELTTLNRLLDQNQAKQSRSRDSQGSPAGGRFTSLSSGGGGGIGGADVDNLNNKLDQTPGKIDKVKGGFDRIGQAIKTAFTVTGILFVIDKVVEFGQKLIDVAGTGEKYQNQFTRIFDGNAKAAEGYLAALQTTADVTNFTFDTLTDNAAKLASRGIIPTKEELLGLGDVANFINKDFTQLNEAILDANNSERWKELGFTVKTQGDKMTLSYGDFTKTVDNSVKGAFEAVQAFSQLGKVQGSTAEAGQTLSGRMSTLGDVFTGLFRTIANGKKGVLNDVIDLLTMLIQQGINLYKTLSPAIDGVGRAFGTLFKAVGGVFSAFSNFQSSAEKTATISQKLGFYINKFIVNPLVAITLVVAGTIEAFNLLVLAGQSLAARLSGNTGLQATIGKQIDASMARLQELKKEGQALRNNFGESLETYVNRDNQRKRREERRQREAEEALQTFKPTATQAPKTATGKTKEQQEAERIQTQILRKEEELAEKRKKLSEELQEVEDDAAKRRLESLDKNSQEYIQLKREQDLKELEQARQRLIEIGQMATGHPFYNKKTKQVEIQFNLKYKLPEGTEKIYQDQRNQINSQADAAAGRLAEDQFEKDKERARKPFTDAREAYEKERAKKLETIQRNIAENELEQQKALNDATDLLIREAGENEIDYERRKNEALLQIKLDYAKASLKLLEQDKNANASSIESLRSSIRDLEADLKKVKLQPNVGPTDLFDLLGIRFDDDAEKNDAFKKQVNDATQAVIDGANQILQKQVDTEQARIDSIDRRLEAKQREVDIEFELQKQGLANNLQLRRKEEAAIQAERQKAIQQQRQYQTIQLSINAALQASELALAVAKIFSANASIPLVGQIAAGIQIAAMIAAFGSTIAQIRTLPKYHDGDEVTLVTANRRRTLLNQPKADEVDARLQIGEGVIRKESYQPNKVLFTRLNKLGRGLQQSDLKDLLDGTGVMMPDEHRQADVQLIQRYNESRSVIYDEELRKNVNDVNENIKVLIADNRRFARKQQTRLPDGRIEEVDEHGNVRIIRLVS